MATRVNVRASNATVVDVGAGEVVGTPSVPTGWSDVETARPSPPVPPPPPGERSLRKPPNVRTDTTAMPMSTNWVMRHATHCSRADMTSLVPGRSAEPVSLT